MIGIDASGVRLGDLDLRRLERFVYEYDFGDSWIHDLRTDPVRVAIGHGLSRVTIRCDFGPPSAIWSFEAHGGTSAPVRVGRPRRPSAR